MSLGLIVRVGPIEWTLVSMEERVWVILLSLRESMESKLERNCFSRLADS